MKERRENGAGSEIMCAEKCTSPDESSSCTGQAKVAVRRLGIKCITPCTAKASVASLATSEGAVQRDGHEQHPRQPFQRVHLSPIGIACFHRRFRIPVRPFHHPLLHLKFPRPRTVDPPCPLLLLFPQASCAYRLQRLSLMAL